LLILSLVFLTLLHLIQTFCAIRRKDIEKKIQAADKKQAVYIRLLYTIASFALYIFLFIPVFGFIAGSIITLTSLMYILGLRNIPLLAGVAIGLPLVLFLLFGEILHIPLPEGILFE
jgi:hypothetical protein